MSDKDRIDWLEEHLAELSIDNDPRDRARVELDFRMKPESITTRTNPVHDIQAGSIRRAIDKAAEMTKRRTEI
jgi:hypothetical protein